MVRRNDTCRALKEKWSAILETLQLIEDDSNEKLSCRGEASALRSKLETFEMVFLSIFWSNVLERFKKVSTKLQYEYVILNEVRGYFRSLADFVTELRNDFDRFDTLAIEKSGLYECKSESQRKRRRALAPDECKNNDTVQSVLSESDNFRVNTFYVMTDSLRAELKRCAEKYNNLQSKFGFLEEIKHSPSSKISEKATELWETYLNDLEFSVVDECLHLKAFLGQTNSSEKESTDISLIELSKFIRKEDIMDLYPNVEIALQMALSTLATNCTGEQIILDTPPDKELSKMITCLKCFLLLAACCSVIARYEEPHRPCYFNPLCTCTNGGPDLGSVSCYQVPFTTIPSQVKYSAIYIMSLKYNQLRLVEENSLNGTGLWKLQINENLLTSLLPKALTGLEKTLSIVDLSGNRITRFPKEAAIKLEKLQTLSLARNRISTIYTDDLFHLGDTLKELDLSSNSLNNIYNDAFKNMKSLEVLNLADNFLISINDAVFHGGFQRLKLLSLKNNQLEHMPLAVLATLKSLRKIDIGKNFISSLNDDSGIFKKIYLEELELEDNLLQDLPHTSFKAFRSIDRINLAGNPITSLNSTAFLDINATEINLSGCLISEISDDGFKGLEYSLESLDLSYNRLEVFPPMFFRKVKKLNFKGNRIAKIPTEGQKQIGETLKFLDISGENMGKFPSRIVGDVPNIRYLSFKKEQSGSISHEDFDGIGPTFEELHLTRNGILKIEEKAFSHPLKIIDLSYNEIASIAEDAFVGVAHSLTKLVLHKALVMAEFPAQIFLQLSKLNFLDVSANRLTTLPSNSFRDLERLKFLNLNHNNFRNLFPGGPNERYNPELQNIKIAFNKLSVIETNSFTDFKRLSQIHLNDNIIKTIRKKAFLDLDSLVGINLKGNLISVIENDAFQNLPSIKVINFSRNKLKNFNLEAFDQVGRLSTLMIDVNRNQIQGLYRNHTSRHKSSNIKILNFSHNNISFLDDKYFHPVRHSLSVLDLSNNKIENLTNTALKGMEHLQILLMSHNEISLIDDDFLTDLVRLQILNISQNDIFNLTKNVLSGQQNLRIFDASKNKLQILDEMLFKSTILERLDLSANEIEDFPEEALCQLSKTLQHLDLSENHISILNASNINCLENLRQLIISRNELYFMDDTIMNQLDKLIVLDVSHNSLNESRNLFSNTTISKLEYLNLANTGINAVPDFLTPALVSMNISGNFIEDIHPTTMYRLEDLQELDLSSNLLKSTYSNILANMNQLQSLYLNDNPIQNFTKDSFMHLTKLQELFIHDLPLQSIDSRTFSPLRSLRKLKMDTYSEWSKQNLTGILNSNRAIREMILHVKDERFMFIIAAELPKSLTNLILEGNQVSYLAENTFKSFQSKTVNLNIHDTQLVKTTSKMLGNMENVRNLTISLTNNKLTSMESIAFSSSNQESKRLMKIWLSGNPLMCDCNFAWLWEWVTDYEYQENCNEYLCENEILKDLRETTCINKENNSFVDVFKMELNCTSSATAICTNSNFIAFTFLEATIFLYLANMS